MQIVIAIVVRVSYLVFVVFFIFFFAIEKMNEESFVERLQRLAKDRQVARKQTQQ